MVCLPGKVIVIIASDVFVAITINIHNKVSLTIPGAQLKEAGY